MFHILLFLRRRDPNAAPVHPRKPLSSLICIAGQDRMAEVGLPALAYAISRYERLLHQMYITYDSFRHYVFRSLFSSSSSASCLGFHIRF
jgi:hypothetical protein